MRERLLSLHTDISRRTRAVMEHMQQSDSAEGISMMSGDASVHSLPPTYTILFRRRP
jgi:hypothetical protein